MLYDCPLVEGGVALEISRGKIDAGVRPGGRATFVSAKVAKTIDAPFSHMT